MGKFTACVLAALVGVAGMAQAVDIRDLQARLAAREATLNDVQAKISSDNAGAPEQMVSLRKNAKITVGGLVTTSYFFNKGKLLYDDGAGAGYQKAFDVKTGSLELSDAELELQIDVNENMDAYLLMDLHQTGPDAASAYGVAEAYWVRWKNIRDTGFGLKVGRDKLVFGDADAQVGYLYNYTQNYGDGFDWWYYDATEAAIAPRNSWDMDGVTQISPYWEGMDGRLLLETSFMAHVWNDEGPYINGDIDGATWSRTENGMTRIRSRNYGLGSMSARATWMPIEDLRLSASVVNFHSNSWPGDEAEPPFPAGEGWNRAVDKYNRNNTAVALSFAWRPSFLSRMSVWSQYVHGWNVNHYDGWGSDAVNFGVSFDLTEKLTVFAQGDYARSSYDDLQGNDAVRDRARAGYAGVMYDLGGGASVEAGWRREKAGSDYRNLLTGNRASEKITNDLIYASLMFEF